MSIGAASGTWWCGTILTNYGSVWRLPGPIPGMSYMYNPWVADGDANGFQLLHVKNITSTTGQALTLNTSATVTDIVLTSGGKITGTATGDIDLTASGAMTLAATGAANLNATGNTNITSGSGLVQLTGATSVGGIAPAFSLTGTGGTSDSTIQSGRNLNLWANGTGQAYLTGAQGATVTATVGTVAVSGDDFNLQGHNAGQDCLVQSAKNLNLAALGTGYVGIVGAAGVSATATTGAMNLTASAGAINLSGTSLTFSPPLPNILVSKTVLQAGSATTRFMTAPSPTYAPWALSLGSFTATRTGRVLIACPNVGYGSSVSFTGNTALMAYLIAGTPSAPGAAVGLQALLTPSGASNFDCVNFYADVVASQAYFFAFTANTGSNPFASGSDNIVVSQDLTLYDVLSLT